MPALPFRMEAARASSLTISFPDSKVEFPRYSGHYAKPE